jgi:hypothetical protein
VSGRHLPPDHDAGDANTIGGYAAVHQRPAAFDGSDGYAYSVELCADAVRGVHAPWAAYLMFLRWRMLGESGIEGHLETDYLAAGASREEALANLGALPLQEARRLLEVAITAAHAQSGGQAPRRWLTVLPRGDEADA